jgi:lysozyme
MIMKKKTIKVLLITCFLIQVLGCAEQSVQPDSTQKFEDVADALPPGILLEETRALIPEGLVLREIYPKGLKLVEDSEGFRNRLYNDAAGYCTIGYGHLIKKRRCNGTEDSNFLRGISRQRGEELLIGDLRWAKYAVQKAVRVNLTDGQYAALVDFVFNVGSGNFQNSGVLRMVNLGQHGRVCPQLRRWVKARGKIFQGLVTRRKLECVLYIEGLRLLPEKEEVLEPIDIEKGETRK